MITSEGVAGAYSQNMLSRNITRTNSFNSSLATNSLQHSTASLVAAPKLDSKSYHTVRGMFTSNYHSNIITRLGNSATAVPPKNETNLKRFEKKITEANDLLFELSIISLFQTDVNDETIKNKFINLSKITNSLDKLRHTP
jgi:hypothetical protein